MTKLHELALKGQSIWLDFIRRSFLNAGKLNDLVEQGLRGVTSNPTIFQKAITGGTDYDAALERLVKEGHSVSEIYESLVIQDIRRAADVLRPVYERTDGKDGFVSLEVNPKLAYDTEGTIMEARRLFAMVDRPNLMIKVPATPEGVPAIETLISEGINVNVTLIFSLSQYEAIAQAYINGLERLAAARVDYGRVASVASFFVSRVDKVVDQRLEELGNTELQGKIAIANAKLAYARFKDIFSGPRWEALAAKGAQVQRPLWASTSTKNPSYPDTMYVDNLIGPNTVNTLPPATLEAFLDHGVVALTLEEGLEEAHKRMQQLTALGIDLEEITEQLQVDGVKSFADSFDALLESIIAKCKAMSGRTSTSVAERITLELGQYQPLVDKALAEMDEAQVGPRIWARSYTVWKQDPSEITNRLGWLDIADRMQAEIHPIRALVQDVQNEGYTKALVLGMGGSSLAPEVFGEVFTGTGIQLRVLDSTHPDAVAAMTEWVDPARTLFIVSSKSGSTVETLSFFNYFYNLLWKQLGEEEAGRHFVVITDPGSRLVTMAEYYELRRVFLADPNIGGRYSALSHFGMVPAGLVGADLRRLLRRGLEAMNDCGPHLSAAENPAVVLGGVMGELARAGRDKLTVVASPQIAGFGDWLEQLVAESTGKEGTGIVPVVGEPLASAEEYGQDRLFVYLRRGDDTTHQAAVQALREAGHPVVTVHLRDRYDLGEQFFLWEFATAVAGHRLGINPFDQPNVESAKVQARKMIQQYMDTGSLPDPAPTLTEGEMAVFGPAQGENVVQALVHFLDQGDPGDYIALQAYVQPTEASHRLLQTLRAGLRARYRLATTLGYGPRFLHSTGQLHKGDAGNGLFVQFTDDPSQDVPIPDEAGKELESVTFGVLIRAQALGDMQALVQEKRRVLRIHLGKDALTNLARLAQAVAPVQEA